MFFRIKITKIQEITDCVTVLVYLRVRIVEIIYPEKVLQHYTHLPSTNIRVGMLNTSFQFRKNIFVVLCSTATINRTRKLHHNTINEETDEKEHSSRKPLVSTQFVQWSSKRFAQPVMMKNKLEDIESSAHYEREWRHIR